jgi:hypothetical protein
MEEMEVAGSKAEAGLYAAPLRNRHGLRICYAVGVVKFAGRSTAPRNNFRSISMMQRKRILWLATIKQQ